MNCPAFVYKPPLRSHRVRSRAAARSCTPSRASTNCFESFGNPRSRRGGRRGDRARDADAAALVRGVPIQEAAGQRGRRRRDGSAARRGGQHDGWHRDRSIDRFVYVAIVYRARAHFVAAGGVGGGSLLGGTSGR
eukprot:29380-Pelagococcus_subviridis.AAC.27